MAALPERANARRQERRLLQALAKKVRKSSLDADRKLAITFFASMNTHTLVKLKETVESCAVTVSGKRKNVPWSTSELVMLRGPLSAADLASHMPGRSVWAIGHKRRQLGASLSRGPRASQPEDFPGTDWTKNSTRLARELGIAFKTAKRLKLLAAGQSADSLKSG